MDWWNGMAEAKWTHIHNIYITIYSEVEQLWSLSRTLTKAGSTARWKSKSHLCSGIGPHPIPIWNMISQLLFHDDWRGVFVLTPLGGWDFFFVFGKVRKVYLMWSKIPWLKWWGKSWGFFYRNIMASFRTKYSALKDPCNSNYQTKSIFFD